MLGLKKLIQDLPEDLRDRLIEAAASTLDQIDEYEIVIQFRKKGENEWQDETHTKQR